MTGSFDIYLGDCLEVMKSIPDSSIDLILTDLPYGTTRCAWDSIIPLADLWAQYLRVAKDNAAIVLTAAQPFTSVLVSSMIDLFRYEWIWEKGNATGFYNAKKQPLRAHESVLVFYRKPPLYVPQMTSGHERKSTSRKGSKSLVYGSGANPSAYDSTDRYPRSVIFFSSDKQKSSVHSTQKPVALMEFLIKTYSESGAVVLDSCMGSATTGVACKRTGRNFIGIEKDPEIFRAAKERLDGVFL